MFITLLVFTQLICLQLTIFYAKDIKQEMMVVTNENQKLSTQSLAKPEMSNTIWPPTVKQWH